MPSIKIHVDVSTGTFQLSGDIGQLWTNRRARFFMNDYLMASFAAEDQMIQIPFQKDKENDKERVLTDIQSMLEKFRFTEELSSQSKEVLNDYLEEQERFKVFTEQARSIWNNHPNRADFESLTAVLKERMTNRTLYDLQLLSAYHLSFSQNACNFSVPGSGKTSVVYAAYTYLNNLPRNDNRYVNKLLIIGPLSSFGPWEDEYQACFGVNGDFRRISADVPRDERVRHFLSPMSAEITLMTYQGVATNRADLISYLRRHENRVMVVLDEAHRIKKTDGGVWAQSVLSLAKYCKSRVVLTGTPAPNGYEDIYNLYNFIWPDKNIIGFPLHQLKEMSNRPEDRRIAELADRVTPFFIRITKNDLKKHMNLPDAIEHPCIYVEMDKVQRSIYDIIESSYIDYFQGSQEGPGIRNALVRSRFIRLLQTVTNPALLKQPLLNHDRNIDDEPEPDPQKEEISNDLEKQRISSELFIDDSELMEMIVHYHDLEVPAKFRMVKEMATALVGQGKKVVIWGMFIQTIKDLKKYLETQGLRSELLIGETPVELDTSDEQVGTREKIIREFNSEHSSFNIIIANPAAVAESISLHKACHNAIYLERNFNAASYLQSKDRIHRVGLHKNDEVNYFYLVSTDSIDETIHQRLIEKEQNMLKIIESRFIPLINMNMDYESEEPGDPEDIKALIKDYVRRTTKDR